MSLALVSLTLLASTATTLGKVTQNDDHYAVQGHSRSLLLVPIKAVCDFLLVNKNFFIAEMAAPTCTIQIFDVKCR